MSEPQSEQSPAVDESNIDRALVWRLAFIVAMGGLLFGYDFMVIGGTTIFYERYFDLVGHSGLLGFSVAAAPIGCILGAAFSMIYADRFGRKRLLIWAALLFLVSAAGTALAWDFTSFIVFRMIGGAGIGLAANQSPMYIAEIAPSSYRGKVVTTNQLTIMVGIVVSQIVNLLIQQHGASIEVASGVMTWNETLGWRLMFGAELIPAIAFLGLMFTVPRSPRWLLKQGFEEEAHRVLSSIGGEKYAAGEVAEISSTISEEETARTKVRDLLEPRLMKIILLGMFLALTQQWSGLNSVFAYSHQIFRDAGIDVSGVMLSLVFQGVTMLLFCVVAMFIVDHVGRKKLMLIGALGIAIVHLLIGFTFHFEVTGLAAVVLVMVAIALYATTLAPIVWVLLSELFPNRIRGTAMGISVVSLWIGYLILIQTFPMMQETMGTAGTFWSYSAFLLVAFFVLLFFLPETKGKSLEQIERELIGPRSDE
jgi:MFS transporter, SP family, arabinose:H+ symporter